MHLTCLPVPSVHSPSAPLSEVSVTCPSEKQDRINFEKIIISGIKLNSEYTCITTSTGVTMNHF